MNTHIRNTKSFAIAVIVAVILFAAATVIFFAASINSIYNSTEEYIYSLTNQKISYINKLIEKDIATVTDFAALSYDYKTQDKTSLLSRMNKLTESNGFLNLIIIDEHGNTLSCKKETVNVAQREYFKKSIEGELVLTEALYSEPDGCMTNIISTPIYGDYKRIIGVAAAVCATDRYSEFLNFSISNERQDAVGYILNSDGDIIFSGENILSPYCPIENSLFDSEFIAPLSEEDKLSLKNNFKKKEISEIIKSQDKNGAEYFAIYSTLAADPEFHYAAVFSEASVYESLFSFTNKIFIIFLMFLFILIFILLGYFLIIRANIKTLKTANEKMSRIAYVDPLTGYSTWDKFEMDVRRLVDNEYRRYAFISFDIDKFKAINDMFGHEEGNRILKLIADTVNRNLSDNETFSRSNSDNFYLLLTYIEDKQIVERIKNIIRAIEYEITEFVPVMTFGVYRINNRSISVRKMGDMADIAKRTVKYGEGSSYAFYNENMLEIMREEKRIENEMQSSLDSHEFCVFFQPKVSLSDKTLLTGAEALVRWIKNNDIISPGKFIPLFERNRFIIKLDYYIMDQVCQKIKQWERLGYSDILVSVNMSRTHLDDPNFASKLRDICHSHDVSTSKIEIEITESAAYDSLETLTKVFEKLKSYGFYISIDDFGAGYSSLNMLKDLQADVLKIDRTFLTSSANNARANNIIAHVIQMARSLGMETICEGIETDEQVNLLRSLGCDMAQGFYYAKPMTSDAFEEILKDRHPTIRLNKEKR